MRARQLIAFNLGVLLFNPALPCAVRGTHAAYLGETATGLERAPKVISTQKTRRISSSRPRASPADSATRNDPP